MRFTSLLASTLLAGCSANLPSNLERKSPEQPKHNHLSQPNYFAGVTPFKPVPAGDWRALNRRVTPEEKK